MALAKARIWTEPEGRQKEAQGLAIIIRCSAKGPSAKAGI